MSKIAIVLPTYNEHLSLPAFLEQLLSKLYFPTLIIVVDDSDSELAEETKIVCEAIARNTHHQICYICRNRKLGRGSAVTYGLTEALNINPSLTHIVQADTDGSHQPSDILRLIEVDADIDVVIGSRYLQESSIIGWSIKRRLPSKMLNFAIPLLLGTWTSDITNGLRRYSQKAAKILVENPPQNSGFISLSEELLTLNGYHITKKDLPITFVDRALGSSSVTAKLLYESLLGVLGLIILRGRRKS